MNVEWQTLEAIRRTEAIDLWYLVSLSGLYRQATHRGSALDNKKRVALTRMLGTSAWEGAWYEEERQGSLLSMLDQEEMRRTASLDRMEGRCQTNGRLLRSKGGIRPHLGARRPRKLSMNQCPSRTRRCPPAK